jgi:hypothetical protein
MRITFDKDSKAMVLDLINKSVDHEGFVVEKDNLKQRVLTNKGEEITLNEFGGVRVGSEIFIKDNLPALMELSKVK